MGRLGGETACPTTRLQAHSELGGAGIQPARDIFSNLLEARQP